LTETHLDTESSSEDILAALKETTGMAEVLVMTSSLFCIGKSRSDLSTKNSRPDSCETVMPASFAPSTCPLLAMPLGSVACARSSRITVNSLSFARPLSLKVISKTARKLPTRDGRNDTTISRALFLSTAVSLPIRVAVKLWKTQENYK
jgi:hypothetical protein